MSINNRKLQVFVSSTFLDLREERQAAVEAILSTGNIPAGMELFAAGDQSQMEVIKEWIRESDVYLLILGGRYGAIEPVSGKSYTHLEYEYALEIGKPHFAIVTSENALNEKVKKHGLDMTERGSTEKYNEFKKLVTGAKLVEFWNDLKGIELAIHKSLSKFAKRDELIGWVRGDQAVDGSALAEEMARLGKENAELKKKMKLDDDYNGLSFKELNGILNNKKVNYKNIRHLISDTPYYINDDSIWDFNKLLISLAPQINRITAFNPNEANGFFEFLRELGIVQYWNMNVPDFTESGRKYLLRLKFGSSRD